MDEPPAAAESACPYWVTTAKLVTSSPMNWCAFSARRWSSAKAVESFAGSRRFGQPEGGAAEITKAVSLPRPEGDVGSAR